MTTLHYEQTTKVMASVDFEEVTVLGRRVRIVTRAHGLAGLNADPESRLRSYEIETGLERRYGGFWVVGEWCPFDGMFTQWRDFAPQEKLDETARWWEEHRAEMTERGLNVDYHIAKLRSPQEPGRWFEDAESRAAAL